VADILSLHDALPISSGPAVISYGALPAPDGTGNSLITPVLVIRPIWPLVYSANQRLPSGPTVIPIGPLFGVGTSNSVIEPDGVMRPILLPFCSVNQRLPSGPALMLAGRLLAVGIVNSIIPPPVVMRPIWLVLYSVNLQF